MRRFRRLLLVLGALPSLASIASGQEFYLREDDRVLFHGEATPGDRLYESFIETFVITRFPRWNVLFIHSAGPGNPQPAALSSQPTLIVVTSGANPVTGDEEGAAIASRDLISGLSTIFPRARVTNLQLSRPLREGNGAAAGARRSSVEAGRSDNTKRIDVSAVMQPAFAKAMARDPARGANILRNGRPVGEAGQLLLAQALLQAWQAPSLVSAVEIDALRGSVRRAENTTVRELESDRVIAWSQDDRSLPMPVDFQDATVALATSCSDFMMTLNQQTLRIRGLAAAWYRLTIDGEPLGFFHTSKLDEGINLAGLPTPMWRQAMEVHGLTRKHDELQAARSRLFEAPAEARKSPEWKKAVEASEAAERDLLDEQRAKARPRTHDYELQPAEN